jgi:hypothetical protein
VTTDQNLLLIRSISFQQLDLLMPQLKEVFPQHKFALLTHPHGVSIAQKSPAIDEVVPYPHKGTFQFWRTAPLLKGKAFDTVIIPVGSLSGGGFFNVIMYAASIPARQRLICYPDGRLELLMLGRITKSALARLGAGFLAGLGTLLLTPLLIVLIPVLLAWLRWSRGQRGSSHV